MYLAALPVLMDGGTILMLLASVLWKGGKALDITWLLGILAVCVTLLSYHYDRQMKRETKVTEVSIYPWLLLLTFLGWSIASFALSQTLNYGLDEILRDTSLILLLFWMTRRIRREDGVLFLERMMVTISVATLVACAVGVGVYSMQPVSRFVGTFFDYRFTTDYWPNAWGEYLLLAWPIAFFWVRKQLLPFRMLVLGVVFGCLLLSYSRGAFLSLTAEAVVFAVLGGTVAYRQKAVQMKNVAKELSVFVVAALIAIGVFAGVNELRAKNHEVQSVVEKATFTAAEGTSSINERSEFWKEAFTLAQEKPLFGWGPYSFRFIQPRLQKGIFITSDHPHNVFLKLAMERGWPAAGLFLLIVLGALGVGTRMLFKKNLLPIHAWGIPVAMTSIIGVMLHLQLDYNLQFVGVALPFFLLLGYLYSFINFSGLLELKRGLECALAACLCLVLITEGIFLGISSVGRRMQAQENAQGALYWYGLARLQLFTRDMHLSRTQLYLDHGDLTQASEALDQYFQQNGEDARAWIMKGDIARYSEKYPEALEAYEQAYKRGKYNYLPPLEGLIVTMKQLNQGDALKQRKAEFDDVLNKYADAILQNSHFIALSQNVEEFAQLTTMMSLAYPNDIIRYKELRQKVLAHASEEREKYTARDSGFLW
jgi:O-antigen ligase